MRTENEADRVVSINGAEGQPPPRDTGGQVDEVQEYETSSNLPQIFTSHPSAKIKHETLKKLKLFKAPSWTPSGARFQPQEGATTES